MCVHRFHLRRLFNAPPPPLTTPSDQSERQRHPAWVDPAVMRSKV